MRAERKHEPTSTESRPSSFVSLLSGWVQQAMESFFATQRILIDVAMRQNANTMKAMREGFSDPVQSPASLITELAVEGTSSFIEAQRILLDLAQQENELLLNGAKERVAGSNAATAMTNLMRRSVDHFVEMQQEFLTIASKQSQTWMHDAKTGKPFDSGRLINIAREGMDNFVRTQKKLLDAIAEETTRATSGKNERPTKPHKTTNLTALARESATSLIEAQKKLLDVASHQMKTNLDIASRVTDVTMPFRLPIPKITGEGIKSFVDAEKALIDSMMKPNRSQTTPPKTQRHAKRHPRPKTKPGSKTASAA